MKIDNLEKIINKIDLKNGDIVYVAGNVYNFGLTVNETKKFCDYLYRYIKKKIKLSGSVVVPTSTLNLINTNKVYDKNITRSYNMGIFSEYIRNLNHSCRSDHPLWSFSGIGKNVKKILNNTSMSAYGEGSIFHKLLDNNTYFISLGKPHTSIGMVHYVEHIIGVPYRYNKEFLIKVKKNNKIIKQYALLGVRFKSKNMVGDGNKKIISKLRKMKTFKIYKFEKGEIYVCKYKKIIGNLKLIFLKNPKIWLKDDDINQMKYYED